MDKHECLLWQKVEGIFAAATREIAEQLYVEHVMCPMLGSEHVDAGVSCYSKFWGDSFSLFLHWPYYPTLHFFSFFKCCHQSWSKQSWSFQDTKLEVTVLPLALWNCSSSTCYDIIHANSYPVLIFTQVCFFFLAARSFITDNIVTVIHDRSYM